MRLQFLSTPGCVACAAATRVLDKIKPDYPDLNEGSARVLKSAAEVKDAEAKGELTIERPRVVVNMPMLTWPGGQR